jgi:transcription antitermination factor NusG
MPDSRLPTNDSRLKWYAVYTKPRWEKKVYALFVEKGMEAYCPLNKVRKQWSDRMKIVEEPLFKSYVFVRVTSEEQTQVRMVSGVVNFVYHERKPAVIRDSEIKVIRKFLNEYDHVFAEPMDLQSDMRVKIQRGVFMDKEAKILEVQGNKIKVNIESIGYSLVAFVDKSNVSMIEK